MDKVPQAFPPVPLQTYSASSAFTGHKISREGIRTDKKRNMNMAVNGKKTPDEKDRDRKF
ncbi:MAG: hypothetical protein EGQ81_08780 [Akkermansia sp.]|nr:hypothetical protein [Akkermansia sp.]